MKPTFRIAPLAGRFRFVTDCIGSTYEDIRDLVDQERDIGMRTFQAAVGREGWRELSDMLGYDRYLPLSRDWHVGYYKSLFRGMPAVFLRHSAIEYIFTPDGRVGPSLASSENRSTSLLARHCGRRT